MRSSVPRVHQLARHVARHNGVVTGTCLVEHVRGLATTKEKKAVKKARGGPRENTELEQNLRALRGQVPDAEPFTEEDEKRFQEIGRRYNIMTSRKHNHLMHDIQTKIDMKWAAINALPAELQAEALEEDLAPPPEGWRMPTWTPPIKGFHLPGEEPIDGTVLDAKGDDGDDDDEEVDEDEDDKEKDDK